MDPEQLELMEPIVMSFLNTAYSEGEWLINEGVVNKDDLEDCEDVVLRGSPMLTIVHCMEKSSHFDDRLIHLSVNKVVDPSDPRYTGPVKEILRQMLLGSQLFRRIPFTQETYNIFRRKLILKFKFNVRFSDSENELFKLVSGLALLITQIEVYRKKFINLINVLNSVTPGDTENVAVKRNL